MTDFQYDFDTNDIPIVNGDFAQINRCSEQNGAMILRKSAASILWPNFGVGFEDFYANLPQVYWSQVQITAERQMKNDYRPDGLAARNPALVARVKIHSNDDGITTSAIINVKYRTE